MLVALGQAPGDLGMMSLVMLSVYSAVPLAPHHAELSGLAAFGGGLLQTGLAIALWPLWRYEPERRALGSLFTELARIAKSPPGNAAQVLPATAQSNQAQTSLASLAGDQSVESDRFQFLLSQAERIRLSLFTLSRLRIRIEREPNSSGELEILDRCFELSARVLAAWAMLSYPAEPLPIRWKNAASWRIRPNSCESARQPRLRSRPRCTMRNFKSMHW